MKYDLVHGRTSPVVFAENLGQLLKHELGRRKKLPAGDYQRFAEDVVEAIQSAIARTPLVWGDLYVYLHDIHTVWIAGEPTLDVVPSSNALGLLKEQLAIANQVIFFQSNPQYYECVRGRLAAERVSDEQLSKVHWHRLDRPYLPQVALYQRLSKPTIGFMAQSPPRIEERGNGYELRSQPPNNWFVRMAPHLVAEHELRLRELLTPAIRT